MRESRVMFSPPYDRRCGACESIGGHAVWCQNLAGSDDHDDGDTPVRAQQSDHGDWVVSKGWMWFPGIYADRDAAELAAVQFTGEQIEQLWGELDTPRPITLDDLWEWEKRDA